MACKSSILIAILVFAALFSIISVSQLTRANYSVRDFKTKPSITEDEAINITISDLEKKVAPLHLDKYVMTQQYFGSPLQLVFVHNNGTVYGIDDDEGSLFRVCDGPWPDCAVGDGNDRYKGHLFYDVNGSWHDASVGNCSPYVYLIDADSGEIAWSRVDDAKAERCDVKPLDW